MVYKLLESAQKNWKRLKGFALLTLVVNNVKFKDGVQVQEESDRNVNQHRKMTRVQRPKLTRVSWLISSSV